MVWGREAVLRAWSRGVLHSLGIRLLVPLFLTVGAVLAGYAFISFRSIQDQFLTLVQGEVHRSSDLIRRATHDGMLLNRLDDVQTTVERIAEGAEVAAIRVFDKAGRVVLSAERSEIGTEVALDTDPCVACHGSGVAAGDAIFEWSHLSHLADGDEVLRHLSVIVNESECAASGCHASPGTHPVLGVLDVEMSMGALTATRRAAVRQLVWATVLLLLIIGGVAAVFIRRVVQRPIALLHHGTERIAGGDLGTRIEVPGRHELARLGDAFNRMATDLSHAQRELTQWSETLEEKVVEKTDELQRAQRQVLHMEKMASLGKLSATVAHELNNPISGVLTYARLVNREVTDHLADDALRKELGDYLTLIERECLRCGDIVRNLLLFAKHRGAEMAPADVNEIVDRSLMLVRHHLEISDVTLTSELLDGDPAIVADVGQLQQAFVALFVNAAEAMASTGRRKELTVRVWAEDGFICIDIADTGVGISPDVLPHIFEPFFSTKGAESGVGLGLAVVYGIIHRHQGLIEVESVVDGGTMFHIRLPREPGTSPEETMAPENELAVR